ncbi:carbohydrate ABC transporter membrane protein 2, CUT1 family [Caloramator quimbayensis]|uniref:Carbohydrate ABC transporter membrane protein 2, CUT1 family n=1 Tax=Caloramator quimbayensis TaxID=1147123 RepID=A0A1T4WFQ1_9CLOT|nr:carbohydrate ABC transporter permease [Caloramator quimbayensis]SKA76120.1 carbohydrate ABC transporter membrane protein 2, CUT1 family [Caloramator quimbayensis]
MAIKESKGERIFHVINVILMVILMILMIYPFWYVIMYSFSKPELAMSGGAFLKPKGFTLDAYKMVFRNRSILYGLKTSLIVTIGGAGIGTLVSAMTAYPLSKKDMPGRKIFTYLFLFTMFFGGGLVPEYLLLKKLHMLDTYWALFLPGCISVWNILVIKNFYKGIPDSLEESAKIDGASDLTVFFKIILPLSKPILATIALFLAVGFWNDFFGSIVYIFDKDKWSLQAVLREIITNTQEAMTRQGITIRNENSSNVSQKTLTMATIMVTTVPILIVYPFVQKYFVKGTMIGSVKG